MEHLGNDLIILISSKQFFNYVLFLINCFLFLAGESNFCFAFFTFTAHRSRSSSTDADLLNIATCTGYLQLENLIIFKFSDRESIEVFIINISIETTDKLLSVRNKGR